MLCVHVLDILQAARQLGENATRALGAKQVGRAPWRRWTRKPAKRMKQD